MNKFGQRMNLDKLVKSTYGNRAKQLKEEAEKKFLANNHVPTTWEHEQNIGDYVQHCEKCKLAMILSMREDRIYGGAFMHICRGESFF